MNSLLEVFVSIFSIIIIVYLLYKIKMLPNYGVLIFALGFLGLYIKTIIDGTSYSELNKLNVFHYMAIIFFTNFFSTFLFQYIIKKRFPNKKPDLKRYGIAALFLNKDEI